MPILPTVGGSSNTWGTELNEYLDPILDMFGTPTTAFEFDTSSLTGLTALSPTPDVENANTTIPGSYYLRDDAGSTSCCGRYMASPATPFTVITRVMDNMGVGSAEPFVAVFVGEATPGVIHGMGHHFSNGTTARYMSWIKFTNPTTFSTGSTHNPYSDGQWYYLAIAAQSNTDIDLMYSLNGYIWRSVQVGLNPVMTIGSVGLMLNAGNVVTAAAFDYLRVWNSTLTFPGVVT